MKAITFKANGKTTTNAAVLAAAIVVKDGDKTFVKFSNPAISAQLNQSGCPASNWKATKITLAKDYLFECTVEE